MSRPRSAAAVIAVALALLAAACSGGDDDAEASAGGNFRSTDEATLDLADQDLPDAGGSAGAGASETDGAEPDGGAGAAGGSGDTTTTIPLNQDEDTVGTMFEALRTFNDCLAETGTTFLGDPRTAEEGSPAADPDYIENLSTCAARSNILQAMQQMQAASEALTNEEIEERNRGLERWAECMRGRGWTMELTPNDRGLLNPTNMQGPDGGGELAGIFESDDMEECAGESQAESDGDPAVEG